jgi:hypothetical protein
MACQLMLHKPIFIIHPMTRLVEKNTKYYIFVGSQNPDILEILQRFGLERKIKKENDSKIQEIFGKKVYDSWKDILKKGKNNKLYFIPNLIRMDDSLNEVKKKIFVYCSDHEHRKYILPRNQEIWIKTKSGNNSKSFKMLGYHYINKETEEVYEYPPHVKVHPVVDPDLLKSYQRVMIMQSANEQMQQENQKHKEYKVDTSENYLLLYDILNNIEVENQIIYVSDALEEMAYLRTHKLLMNEKGNRQAYQRFLNGYLKKYWIHIQPEIDIERARGFYEMKRHEMLRDEFILKLMEQNIVDKSLFEDCSMKTVKINVNSKGDDDEEETVIEENENENRFWKKEKDVDFVDLYQIFDYIREKRINVETPFVKYGDITMDNPFVIISLEAIRQNKLSKHHLYDWLNLIRGSDEIAERRFHNLQIKRYIKNYENDQKYCSINLSRNGKVSISISYKQENRATIQDIELAVKNCKKLIEDLNQHIPDYRLIRGISENKRIEAPDMTVHENGTVSFKRNTKLTFVNMLIGMNIPNEKQIDFKKLEEFAKFFPNYLSEDRHVEKKSEIVKNKLYIRYNRVSAFSNMNEISVDIDKMKEQNFSDISILELISQKYDLTLDEAKKYLIEWVREFSDRGTGKVKSQYKTGVRVQIFRDKMIFDGITNIYQIPEIYRFFTFFIYLFLEMNEMKKNKDFRQFFLKNSATINTSFMKNEIDYEQEGMNYVSELNRNMYLQELEGLEGIQIQKNANRNIANRNFQRMMNFNVNEVLESNLTNKVEQHLSLRGSLLAKEEDIDVNIRLDCGDTKEVEEVQTCEDFCNDANYFIRRLQLYDNSLFKFNVTKNKDQVQYSRCCQSNDQPVVLDYDPSINPRIKRESYSYTYEYSSDPELMKRWYICPKIWCPYCEIPIYENDVDRRTILRKKMKGDKKFCITCKCPYGDHQAFIRDDKMMNFEEEKRYLEDLKKLKTEDEKRRYIKSMETKSEFTGFPTFALQKNPRGKCLPCCSKKPHNIKESGKYEHYMSCRGEEVEEENKDDGHIYIKKSIPVDRNRFGILTSEVARILNTIADAGSLGMKSGYFRRGIKQSDKLSFLNAMSDIISCEKSNPIPVEKIQKNLNDKLTEDLFKSLYAGNLVQIFIDKTKNTTSFENFKHFLQQQEQQVNHTYLWDYVQRPGILYEDGVNLFIFEDNLLLCPKGEDVKEFYDMNKKNVILFKHKHMYEPVVYLDGDGKGGKMKCLFDSSRPEIRKLHEIVMNGCGEQGMIRWDEVLQNTIKKYGLDQRQMVLGLGDSLMITLEKILTSIKQNDLKTSFIPTIQYIDGYNKVYAIGLKNGVFLPVRPSKLYLELPYEEVVDLTKLKYLNYEDTKRYLMEISEKTGMTCKISEKILDHSSNQKRDEIIAVILENDRIVPVQSSKDRDSKVRVSSRVFYGDIDKYIQKSVDYLPDKRIEMMNKKSYEDESYQRLRFEISRYIQLKNSRDWKKKLMEIIDDEGMTLHQKRRRLFDILQTLVRKLVVIGDRQMDIVGYQKPNKRVPCFQRSKNKNENHQSGQLSCQDDSHCIVEGGECKLFMYRKNLVDKGRDNEIFYVDRIIEELLRYPLKRNEILHDNISSVIDRELLIIDPKKYVLMHGETPSQMIQIMENIYMDRTGIQLNKRILYNEFITQNYTFVRNRYLKASTKNLDETLLEPIPSQWEPYLDTSFKMQKNTENSLFVSLSYAFREMNSNVDMSAKNIQMKIVQTLETIRDNKNLIKKFFLIMNPLCVDNPKLQVLMKNIGMNIPQPEEIEEKGKKKKKIIPKNGGMDKPNMTTLQGKLTSQTKQMENMMKIDFDENVIVNLYKNQCRKLLSHIQSFEGLMHDIMSDKHIGCEMDIIISAYMMGVNIIILDKFKHKEAPRYYCIGNQFDTGYSNYIILYKALAFDKNIYYIVESKGKYLFDLESLPYEFKTKIIDQCYQHRSLDFEC